MVKAIYTRFFQQHVEVKADRFKVQGILHAVSSGHEALGNLILETENGTTFIKGKRVRSIGILADVLHHQPGTQHGSQHSRRMLANE